MSSEILEQLCTNNDWYGINDDKRNSIK